MKALRILPGSETDVGSSDNDLARKDLNCGDRLDACQTSSPKKDELFERLRFFGDGLMRRRHLGQ